MKGPERRIWQLPTHEELDKEQDAILYAPGDGHMLITGGPGTGKTIMALLYAIRRCKNGERVLVLMYHNTLAQACRAQIQGNSKTAQPDVQTALRWAKEVSRDVYRVAPGRFEPVWEQLEDKLYEEYPEGGAADLEQDILVIDEGQDLKEEYYTFLRHHSPSVIVAADDNQRFTDPPTTEKEIIDALEVEDDRCFRLQRNYRNTKQIAAFADCFKKGIDEDIQFPEKEGDKPKLVRTSEVEAYLRGLAKKQLEIPSELTAVVTHNHPARRRFLAVLGRVLPPEWLSTYDASGNDVSEHLRFDRGGLVVICAQSCKGLEFDNVILAPLNDFPLDEGHEEHYRTLYVMATRARSRLILLQDVTRACPVADFLEKEATGLFEVCPYKKPAERAHDGTDRLPE